MKPQFMSDDEWEDDGDLEDFDKEDGEETEEDYDEVEEEFGDDE